MKLNGDVKLEARSERRLRKREMTKNTEGEMKQMSKRARIRENKRLKRAEKKMKDSAEEVNSEQNIKTTS